MKNLIIFNASYGTRELPKALLSAVRRSVPLEYNLSIRGDYGEPSPSDPQKSQQDDNDSLYLIICPAGLRRPPPKNFIAWQLEFLGNKNDHDPDNAKYFDILRKAKKVWEYSRYNLKLLADRGIQATYVPIGYSECISSSDLVFDVYTYSDEGRTTDVLFLCYCDAYPRRIMMRDMFDKRFKCAFPSDLDIDGMRREMRKAKICINVHVEMSFILEIIRLNIMLSNQCCILSEPSIEPMVDMTYEKIGVKFVKYENMIDEAQRLLNNFEERRRLAITSFYNYRRRRRWEDLVDFGVLIKEAADKVN